MGAREHGLNGRYRKGGYGIQGNLVRPVKLTLAHIERSAATLNRAFAFASHIYSVLSEKVQSIVDSHGNLSGIISGSI